jgi:hypothetical protein
VLKGVGAAIYIAAIIGIFVGTNDEIRENQLIVFPVSG